MCNNFHAFAELACCAICHVTPELSLTQVI
jgi:hypothetical protein